MISALVLGYCGGVAAGDEAAGSIGVGSAAAGGWDAIIAARRLTRHGSAAAVGVSWGSVRRWPGLKNCPRADQPIVVIDGSGISEPPQRIRPQEIKGQTPVRRYGVNWQQRSAIARISFWHLSFSLIAGTVRAPEIVPP